MAEETVGLQNLTPEQQAALDAGQVTPIDASQVTAGGSAIESMAAAATDTGLAQGPGVVEEEHKDTATPLTPEEYIGTDRSFTQAKVGAADGVHESFRVICYDKTRNVTFTMKPEDGPDEGGDFWLNPEVPDPAQPAPAPEPAQPVDTSLEANAASSPVVLLLDYIFGGQPTTAEQYRLVNAWVNAEGGTNHNNPLNVTAPLNGSWKWTGQNGFWNNLGDGFGVVTFDTLENGCQADARVLTQANMAPILEALKAGDATAFVAAFPGSWGTNPVAVQQLLDEAQPATSGPPDGWAMSRSIG